MCRRRAQESCPTASPAYQSHAGATCLNHSSIACCLTAPPPPAPGFLTPTVRQPSFVIQPKGRPCPPRPLSGLATADSSVGRGSLLTVGPAWRLWHLLSTVMAASTGSAASCLPRATAHCANLRVLLSSGLYFPIPLKHVAFARSWVNDPTTGPWYYQVQMAELT